MNTGEVPSTLICAAERFTHGIPRPSTMTILQNSAGLRALDCASRSHWSQEHAQRAPSTPVAAGATTLDGVGPLSSSRSHASMGTMYLARNFGFDGKLF